MPSSALPVKFQRARRPSTCSSQISSGSALSMASSFLTDPDPEELDCFRSMRGIACDNTKELNNAIQDDIHDLSSRLVNVRKSGEAEKRVQDEQGQAYQILVTRDDVRLCHVDERGQYHFEHFSTPTDNSNDTSTSSSQHYPRSRKQRRRRRHNWKIVDDAHGNPFLLISNMWVIVLHLDGIWCCQRVMGKVLDSDTLEGITANAPKPWLRTRDRHDFKPTVYRGQRDDVSDWQTDTDNESVGKPEALLCANTPGERGQHPLAYKSFYHDF